MNSLSIGIVSVPERYGMALRLNQAIREDSKETPVSVCLDKRHVGPWFNTRRAWEYGLKQKTTHVMTIEEDVEICSDFVQSAISAIAIHPNDVISLYSTKTESNMTNWAIRNNSHWYRMADAPSGLCVILPRKLVFGLLDFDVRCIDPKDKYEDTRLYGFMYFKNLYSYVVVPNLVEHLAPSNSSLGFNNSGKVSACYIGHKVSGLSIDLKKDKSELKCFSAGIKSPPMLNFKKSYLGDASSIKRRIISRDV